MKIGRKLVVDYGLGVKRDLEEASGQLFGSTKKLS